MANVISKSQNPFGVSFIQTQSGATITGEIKRYLTYKDMVEDPAPTRLASVTNASRDDGYAVPEDHVGGVLFQRDFINNTWILLYTEADLAVPTYVDWSHILNVPPWVGGVSNNRVKLTQHTNAVPRTTYYSYGPYKLMLPPADMVPLGDEIVLEQYDNYGFVLFQKDERVPLTGKENTVTDITTTPPTVYFVVYTYPEFEYEVTDANGTRVATSEKPVTCNSFRFIRTETNDGVPFWSLVTDGDNLDVAVRQMKADMATHVNAKNPHNMYILKEEAAQYLSTDTKYATTERYGTLKIAAYDDLGRGTVGALAVTPSVLYSYLYQNFALKNHTHSQYALVDHTHNQYALVNHQHRIDDVDGLREELDGKAPKKHTHEIDDVNELWSELDKKQNKLLSEGRYISVSNDTVDCTVPDASTQERGIVQLTDAITDENRQSAEVALTPAALLSGFAVDEHILAEYLGPSPNGEMVGRYEYQNYGWIKFPFANSQKYPNHCLAMAWGWTEIYTMPAGNFVINIGLPGYCIFHRINHVELVPISSGGFADVILTYKLAFGTPTPNGTDVVGLNEIQAYANPVANKTSDHSFQVYWKVIGYVSANTDETWDQIESVGAYSAYSPSGDAQGSGTAHADNMYYEMPTGAVRRYAGAGEKETRSGTVTYTLSRAANEGNGTYLLDGLAMQVHARSNYKGGYAHACIYVMFNHSVIDMVNRTISNVTIIKQYAGDSSSTVRQDGVTIDIGTGAVKTIASCTGHIEHRTRTVHAYFKVSYSNNAIQLQLTCDSWSQHSGTDSAIQCYYLPCEGVPPNFVYRYVPAT